MVCYEGMGPSISFDLNILIAGIYFRVRKFCRWAMQTISKSSFWAVSHFLPVPSAEVKRRWSKNSRTLASWMNEMNGAQKFFIQVGQNKAYPNHFQPPLIWGEKNAALIIEGRFTFQVLPLPLMSDPLLAVGTWAMVPCVDRIFILPQAPGILNTGPGVWTGMVNLVGIEGVGPIFDTGGNRSVIDMTSCSKHLPFASIIPSSIIIWHFRHVWPS